MANNVAIRSFTATGTFTVPAGVTKLSVKTLTARNVKLSSGGSGNTSALTKDGKAYAWGNNTNGQLGDGTVVSKSSPVPVLGGLVFKEISSGIGFICGITPDGTPYSWGLNDKGQLGVGDTAPRSSPVAVVGGLKFKKIVATDYGCLALTSDGTLYSWGDNTNGQLGDGTVVAKSSPVAVLGGLKFVDMSGGNFYASALKSDGTAYSWGLNGFGQLGLGDVTPRSSPVAVVGGLKFATLKVGSGQHMLGLTLDGKAYAWGRNDFGQLGDNTAVAKSSPVAVVGGLTFKQIFPGYVCSLALDMAGKAWCWGGDDNSFFSTGAGDNTARSSPFAVTGGLLFDQIEHHYYSGFAVDRDGKMYGWGCNSNGRLGDASTTNRSTPTQVTGGLFFAPLPPAYNAPIEIPVIPGTTYNVSFNGDAVYFDKYPLGNNIYQVDVTYEN